MFRRRVNTPLSRIRNFVWPRKGFSRVGSYLRHRVGRLPGTPHSIALGFAAGVGTSFTPLVGLHILLAATLVWPFGGSLIAAAIGSLVGNPWTFPFMWIASYTTGCWLIGQDPRAITFEGVNLPFLWEHKLEILVPWLVGSVPMGLAGALAFYFPVRSAVTVYQAKRRERRRARERAGIDRRETP